MKRSGNSDGDSNAGSEEAEATEATATSSTGAVDTDRGEADVRDVGPAAMLESLHLPPDEALCDTNRELQTLCSHAGACMESPTAAHGRLMLTPATGVHCFCVSESDAAAINTYLLDPWNRNEHGFLQVGLATFAGYGDYQRVEVNRWDKATAPVSQESFSTIVPRDSFKFASCTR